MNKCLTYLMADFMTGLLNMYILSGILSELCSVTDGNVF